MKKLLAAFAAIALTAVLPAQATTFSVPTVIYVAPGVFDGGGGSGGTATTVACSNVSGQNATVKWIVYAENGFVADSSTQVLAHGKAYTVSTHGVFLFADEALATGAIFGGTFAIQSTQSGVFCSAMIVDAGSPSINGVALHMVRYRPHTGTVE